MEHGIMLSLIGKTLAGLFVLLLTVCIVYLALMSGSFYTPKSTHVFGDEKPGYEHILVVGGTRGTGLDIVRDLKQSGKTVTALVRASSNITELSELDVQTVVGDAMIPETLETIIQSGNFDAVISTLGTSARDLPKRQNFIQSLVKGQTKMAPGARPDFVGNKNLVDAAVAGGVSRFILVTVIGAGDSAEALPLAARRGHSDVIPLKTQAEDYLKASGLDYTIVRPGGLSNGASTGSAFLSSDPKAFSYIARKDLSELVVRALNDTSTFKATYTSFDPQRPNLWNLFLD